MKFNNAKELLKGIKKNLKDEKKKLKDQNVPKSKYPKEKIKTRIIDDEVIALLYGFIADNIFYIDEVFVNEEHRKKGIASQLIKEAIEEAQKNNCSMVYAYLEPYDKKYMLENILMNFKFEFIGSVSFYRLFLLRIN